MTARNCSSVIFTIRASLVMPALLTSTLISPSTASRMRCAVLGVGDVGDDAVHATGRGRRAAPRGRRSGGRRRRAPIPRAAPVTIARSYLDLAHVRRVHADEFAGDAAARLELRDPVLQVLRVGVRADRDRVGAGGPRRRACASRSAARWPGSRPGTPRWPSRSSWREHEDDRLLVARGLLRAPERVGERGLDLGPKSCTGGAVKITPPPAACSAGSCPSASSGAPRRT